MSSSPTKFALIAIMAIGCNGFAGLTPEQPGQVTPPASHAIDFTKDTKPILVTRCVKCHGRGKEQGRIQNG